METLCEVLGMLQAGCLFVRHLEPTADETTLQTPGCRPFFSVFN